MVLKVKYFENAHRSWRIFIMKEKLCMKLEFNDHHTSQRIFDNYTREVGQSQFEVREYLFNTMNAI
jgi:hypothetical protein